jgi:acid phosphatase type 7
MITRSRIKELIEVGCFFWVAFAASAVPRHVYLTWQSDTSTTITVNYQTMEQAETSHVYYDTRSRNGKIADYKLHATGTRHSIPGLQDNRTIHWVELSSLEPDKTYYFVAGDEFNGFTSERKFRTVPDGTEKLRFVDGGDMGTGPALPVLLKHAAKQEPSFGVVGGDIAYANDILTNYARWDAWLDAWQQCMITPKGYTIPMVLAIGNHEVRGTNSFFYFGYFAQNGERSYYSRKFGKNLVMYLLDSGHMSRHGPEQAAWLDTQMQADAAFPYRFAVYHVPLYPAYRAFNLAGSVAGRNAWLQIFDKHRLTTAFEHHDHVFKRTKLLRNNQVDPQGTLYLGDGCWGMPARPISNERPWYEEKGASLQHFWLVDVSKKRVEYRAFNLEGKVFDVYPPNARGAKEADEVFASLKKPAPAAPAAPPSNRPADSVR